MTRRANQRPDDFAKPDHWDNAPPPRPVSAPEEKDSDELSPTRYGDWVRNGIAVDF